MAAAASPFDYSALLAAIANTPLAPLANSVPADLAGSVNHGDFPKWLAALQALPALPPAHYDLLTQVRAGEPAQLAAAARAELQQTLLQLHPWRKGPFDLFGLHIDTEWRSDWKWDRLVSHIAPLQGRRVLDVGCGNGYHCWRMAGAGASLVVGVEPMLLYVLQYWALRHFLPAPPVYVLPATLEQMPEHAPGFDTVFSMGVLYHRRSPFEHLDLLKKKLRKGGELILETLVVEGGEGVALVPRERYCRMNNVWFLPSSPTLATWLQRAGFHDIRLVDEGFTTLQEQRQTPWMTFESLAHALDPANPACTIEGHPAPRRAIFVARLP